MASIDRVGWRCRLAGISCGLCRWTSSTRRPTTAELPPLDAGRVPPDREVFSGRARPVVLSDLELALIDEADDRSVHREWLRPAGSGDVDGEGSSGRPLPLQAERRASLASFIAHGAVVVVLAIPAILVVAFGIAAAAR
jgi:hypothetical protein